MTKTHQKIGRIKALILTNLMREHMGVTDAVEVTLESNGKITLTAPDNKPRIRQSFEEAKAATLAQYDEAIRRLAEL